MTRPDPFRFEATSHCRKPFLAFCVPENSQPLDLTYLDTPAAANGRPCRTRTHGSRYGTPIAVCNDIEPQSFACMVPPRQETQRPLYYPRSHASQRWVNFNDYRYRDL